MSTNIMMDVFSFVFQSFFDVSPETGEVRVANRLDREMAAVVTLTVVVTDISATPLQTGTGNFVFWVYFSL